MGALFNPRCTRLGTFWPAPLRDYDLACTPRRGYSFLNRTNQRPGRRRSLRLQAYDYAQTGAYFVSITVQERLCLFGEISDERMCLNEAGRMVGRAWEKLPQRFPTIQTDAFVVMPNHLHGIILIDWSPPTESANAPAAAQPAGIPVGAPLVGAQHPDPPATAQSRVGAPLVDAQGQDAAATCQSPVGAPLVGAQPPDPPATGQSRVGAPLVGAQHPDAAPTSQPPVGAPLVGAQPPDPPATGQSRVGAPLVGARGQDAADTAKNRIRLGDVIGAYKSLTTVNYIRAVKTRNWPPFRGRLWQRNYYEHVVRSDESLLKIREYILYNPARWASDRDNPQAIASDSSRTLTSATATCARPPTIPSDRRPLRE